MSFAIVQVVDDSMLPFFVCSQESRLIHCPQPPGFIIPFSDRFGKIAQAARLYGCQLLEVDVARYERLGTAIFEDAVQRNPVRKSAYFRKLAIFECPGTHFLFMDANTVFLSGIEQLERKFRQSGYFAAFHGRAAHGRNFGSGELFNLLNEMSPGIRQGYNFGCAMGRCDPSLLAIMEALAGPGRRLAAVLGSAPEQGFLSYCLAITGKPSCIFSELTPDMPAAFGADNNIKSVGGDAFILGEKTASPGKTMRFIKWNGSKFDPELPNFHILQSLYDSALARHGDALRRILA